MKQHSSHIDSMRSMTRTVVLLAIVVTLVWALPALPGAQGIANYLPLHMLLETFAIVVAMLVFAVGWHAYNRNLPGNIVLLACAFLGVGLLDFAHMLSFAGMPDFVTPSGPEKAIDFWLAARALAALALLAATTIPWRPLASDATRYRLLAAVLVAVAFAYWLVLLHQDKLPNTFVPGRGLTALKIAWEYAIIALNLTTALILWKRMRGPLPFDASMLFGAVCTMALSEFLFTLYANVTDIYNLLGHIYKTISYLLLYRAIFASTVEAPYRQLHRSEVRLHTLYDTTSDTVMLLDEKGFFDCNPATLALFGCATKEEFCSKHPADLSPPRQPDGSDSMVLAMHRIGEAMEKGHNFFEWTHRRADTGENFPAEVLLSRMELDGKMVLQATVRDITQRKHAEKALAESDEAYRFIQATSMDGFWVLDMEGRVLEVSQRYCEQSGYTPEELLGMRIQDIEVIESAADTEARIRRIFETGRDLFESMHRRKDGSAWNVEVSVTYLPSRGGRMFAFMRDITERKRAEEALRESDEAYRNIQAASMDGFWVAAMDGRILEANQRYCEQSGYTREELVGMRIPDLEARESTTDTAAHIQRITETGRELFETMHRHKDGSVWHVEASVTYLPSKGGRFFVFLRDISGRKKNEEALRKLSLAVEQSPVSIVITDLDANIEYANKAFVKGTGYSFAEAIGQNPRILNSGKNPKETYEKMWACLAHGEMWRGELVNRRKDGSEYVESVSISPVMDGDGRATHYLAVKENITERKADEAKIKRLSQIYRLLSRVNEAIVRSGDRNELFSAICQAAIESGLFRFVWVGMLDENWVIPVAHAGAEDGYLSGKFNILIDNEHTGNGPTGRAIRAGAPVICQDIEHDSGMAPWRDEALKRGYRASAAFPVRESGVVAGAINVYAGETLFFTPDISELMLELATDVSFALDNFTERERREKAETEILALNIDLERRVVERTHQLETVNRELEAFCYSVSHDLRAPLRSIDGFGQVLLKKYHDRLDATGQDYLERVCRAAQRMGLLIEDLLQLSRVTRSALKREHTDLSSLAEELATELRKAYPERNVRYAAQPELAVYGDSGLLRILMENLIGNAWKYTCKKTEAIIEFGAHDNDGEQVFFVRDNGAGFNMDYAHKLFGAFQRMHSMNEFEGTGIGLATAQRIVHRHRGRIWAKAKEGEGATFYFTLPQRDRGDMD